MKSKGFVYQLRLWFNMWSNGPVHRGNGQYWVPQPEKAIKGQHRAAHARTGQPQPDTGTSSIHENKESECVRQLTSASDREALLHYSAGIDLSAPTKLPSRTPELQGDGPREGC